MNPIMNNRAVKVVVAVLIAIVVAIFLPMIDSLRKEDAEAARKEALAHPEKVVVAKPREVVVTITVRQIVAPPDRWSERVEIPGNKNFRVISAPGRPIWVRPNGSEEEKIRDVYGVNCHFVNPVQWIELKSETSTSEVVLVELTPKKGW